MVNNLNVKKLDWAEDKTGTLQMEEVSGPDTVFKTDLVLLAMGFVHPIHEGLLDELGVKYDERGNIAAKEDDFKTSIDSIFAAGDARRGQSLVVWAIREGRGCAASIHKFLSG